MSTEENKDLVRRLFDAVNRRSLEELDTLLGPEFLHDGEPVGLDDSKEFVDWHVSVLTEVRFAIEDLIAEPSKLAGSLPTTPSVSSVRRHGYTSSSYSSKASYPVQDLFWRSGRARRSRRA